jgi:hypothetical protein
MSFSDLQRRSVSDPARLELAGKALTAAATELARHDLDAVARDARLAADLARTVATNEAAETAAREPQGTLW